MLNQTEPNRKRIWPVEITPYVSLAAGIKGLISLVRRLVVKRDIGNVGASLKRRISFHPHTHTHTRARCIDSRLTQKASNGLALVMGKFKRFTLTNAEILSCHCPC